MKDILDFESLKAEDKEYFFDSLTKVISRQFIIKIAQKLIDDKTPFTMMILDLDNFKQVNDSFGHLSGDFILESIGEGLIKNFSDKAYIGRYGGDEFIIILPKIIDYDDVHIFLEGLFERDKIFRRFYNDGVRDIYITATLGCAKYPSDGSDYEELFNKADKALYRGKSKGRNCYIIYVHDKHKDIVIHEKVEGSLIEHFNSVNRLFDLYDGKEEIVKHIMDYLYLQLHCTGAYFLTVDKKLISHNESKSKSTGTNFAPHLEILLNGDKIFYQTPLTKYKHDDSYLSDFIERQGIQAIMVSKIEAFGVLYGYIMISENKITRVWQESEIALLMYISSLLELRLMYLDNKND